MVRAVLSSVLNLVVLAVLVFWPAGTFDYWRGWTFIAVFGLATLLPGGYLAVTDPAALQRRMQAGPRAETRTVQKWISVAAFGTLVALIVFSALDFRFGWSTVPPAVSVFGALLVAAGLGIAMLAVIQNSYAAANVTVEAGQRVASTGMYRLVRHPMYFGNVVMMIGIPPALGSYWGLVFLLPGLLMLGLRIGDEERLLRQELAGYREYAAGVRYRLVPYVW